MFTVGYVNEARLIQLYADITGCSEALARSVITHYDLFASERVNEAVGEAEAGSNAQVAPVVTVANTHVIPSEVVSSLAAYPKLALQGIR